MKVLIAGIDGYLGWPLAQYLTQRGHVVAGIDALLRRQWVTEMGSDSAIPICSINDRLAGYEKCFGQELLFREGNLLDYKFLKESLAEFQPDAIVHFAEMPSAPYSMIDQEHSFFTQQNNVMGSLNLLWAIKEVCPETHLIKLGTMGEYGTPNLDIPEGFFEIEFRGRKDVLPFPRQAGSFYHWSKVHDSNNTMFACRIWGLKATDIMQGVVFGTRIDNDGGDPSLRTRLDFDQCFGTAINRFCCQAVIEHPLTVYGGGGQIRGFIPLRDSMQCVALVIENPPSMGEYRVFNQFDRTYTIEALASLVQVAASDLGINVVIQNYENPRTEMAKHHYNPDRNRLVELGYKPFGNIVGEIKIMLDDLSTWRERIIKHKQVLIPDIRWDGSRRPSRGIN
ncbi:MAG: NAD-dependent epimerase/dehydratase family protein [Chloroflexi bacterium]|nr:NAD-dependent epimerase/dehydratase family protein [Chloroflexota bacterium]MCC6891313.1 NAD-dependent epimerase/dehydratase family protein [Anaerolineae bacterium]